MSQLIGLIIAIALGAIVTAIGYVFLGNVFNQGADKAEAQRILAQEQQIMAAITAYKIDNLNTLTIGSSDPNLDGNYTDSSLLTPLVEGRYLKEDILNTSESMWFLPTGEDKVTTNIQDENVCLSLNHQHPRTQYSKTGVVDGQFITSTITAVDSEIVNGVPICGTPTASMAACCVNP